MRYSNKKKFIFFHVPKTGGTSVRVALDSIGGVHEAESSPSGLAPFFGSLGLSPERPKGFFSTIPSHVSAAEIKYKLGSLYDDYFTFGFLRNPWAWKVSLYHFILSRPKHKQHALYKSYKDFADYIKRTDYAPGDALMNSRRQTAYIFDASGPVVSHVGALERVQEDFDVICDNIGIKRRLMPHSNKSAHTHYTDYYDRESEQIVAEHYARDVEYFGYKFGD